ncbi:MAG: helix-turn-helix transcriptional regulator [Clostridiales Family XIII bacterium]|jgi:putative transcriptional regulator|nr:helix-turn-helix transcriptional regulator [Clostridiales Family XIII bacterium]
MQKNLKLKSMRALLDLTQAELAERVGVSRQTINAIEKGEYNPTIKLCTAICKTLGKTLNDIFWEDDNDEQSQIR